MGIWVERIEDPASAAKLRTTWNTLAKQTTPSSFVLSYDWFASYWRHFGDTQKMLVLVVREADQCLGIVPLVIRSEESRRENLSVCTYPLDGWGSFGQPLTSDPWRTIQAATEFLNQHRNEFHVLSWRGSNSDHPATDAIQSSMRQCGMPFRVTTSQSVAWIDLPSDWDTYLQSRPDKFRNDVIAWTNRLGELGKLRFEKYRPRGGDNVSPRWDLYDACEEIASRSWQGSSASQPALSHESVSPFLRDVHVMAASVGALDMNLLYLNDHPVAFEYGYWQNGYKFSLQSGYDVKQAAFEIGNLMWLETIKSSIEAGDLAIDMGSDSFEFKKHFSTRTLESVSIEYLRSGVQQPRAVSFESQLSSWWTSVGNESSGEMR